MSKAKPQAVHPRPGEPISENNEDETKDDEKNDGEVNHQYDVGENLIEA
jgi:hypothetical protein